MLQGKILGKEAEWGNAAGWLLSFAFWRLLEERRDPSESAFS